jgi:hypothetical protein
MSNSVRRADMRRLDIELASLGIDVAQTRDLICGTLRAALRAAGAVSRGAFEDEHELFLR